MDELGAGKAKEIAENVASVHGVFDGEVVVALGLFIIASLQAGRFTQGFVPADKFAGIIAQARPS